MNVNSQLNACARRFQPPILTSFPRHTVLCSSATMQSVRSDSMEGNGAVVSILGIVLKFYNHPIDITGDTVIEFKIRSRKRMASILTDVPAS